MRRDWNRNEIEAVVEAYFWMLGEQIAGHGFSKLQVAQRLQFGELASRNRSAIDRKFSNVSAILDGVGAPWVRGYKPLSHVQGALQHHVIAVAKRRGLPVRPE